MKSWGTSWGAAILIHVVLGVGLWLLASRARQPDESVADAPIEIETIVTTRPPGPTPAAPVKRREPNARAPEHVVRADTAEASRPPPGAAARAAEPARPAPETPPPTTAFPSPGAIAAPAPGVDLHLRADPFARSEPAQATGPAALDLRSQVPGPIADGRKEGKPPKTYSMGSDLLSMGDLIKSWAKNPEEHARAHEGGAQLFHGTFDVTDSLMRANGQDPYRAQKVRALDVTREQRLAAAVRDGAERQREALAALPSTLRRIWGDRTESPRRRREKIFLLWDECDEARSADDESPPAGARARRLIVAFIRAELGAGTDGAYPVEELAALNAHRDSRQPFDPYSAGAHLDARATTD